MSVARRHTSALAFGMSTYMPVPDDDGSATAPVAAPFGSGLARIVPFFVFALVMLALPFLIPGNNNGDGTPTTVIGTPTPTPGEPVTSGEPTPAPAPTPEGGEPCSQHYPISAAAFRARLCLADSCPEAPAPTLPEWCSGCAAC